ncbi:TetR family transcriptional regulator C-terminal domain-containing protein [Streptomyces sp. NPDC050856]|uniref:TetR family transcriptional regulator C-terminal domain-containing protein n=1 Tax=Streptomyces sp. NPDC050856 TaxID=3154939 RepID=UPI00340F1690
MPRSRGRASSLDARAVCRHTIFRLTRLPDDGTGRIAPELLPLATTSLELNRLRSRLIRLRAPNVVRLLRRLAVGSLPLTHKGRHGTRRHHGELRAGAHLPARQRTRQPADRRYLHPQAASTLLSHTLAELAPLDEESRTQAHVWLAFVTHAPASEELAAVLRDTYVELHGLIAWLIRYGQDTRKILQHVDPEREAHTLLALADGLTVHVLAATTPRPRRWPRSRATSTTCWKTRPAPADASSPWRRHAPAPGLPPARSGSAVAEHSSGG